MTKWSEHVKKHAKKHKMSYREASMDSKCKESYRKKRMSPRKMSKKKGSTRRKMNNPDQPSPCTVDGRYRCPECERENDPISLEPIKKERGVCVDKQCYDSLYLKQALEGDPRVPTNRKPMTPRELDAIMIKTRVDLRGRNLEGAYLTRSNLMRATLEGAYLTGAYLTGAYLQEANLMDADLTGADLTGADLRKADLTRADTTGAGGGNIGTGTAPVPGEQGFTGT